MPTPLTRRTLLGGLLGGAATLGLEGFRAGPAHAGAHVPAEAGTPRTVTTVTRRLLGRSGKGRPIWVHELGAADAAATVLVVGSMHGNERAGIPIARLLVTREPGPGVRLVVVPTMNPDGDVLGRRQNARGVDLNRNFPGGAHRGRRGDVHYSGPRDLSEVEARLMHGLVTAGRLDAVLVYHQQMNLVDHCGGSLALARAYAAQTGMGAVRLPRYPGSMATWLHQHLPSCTILTVELPARVDAAQRRRHARAVHALAARAAAKVA